MMGSLADIHSILDADHVAGVSGLGAQQPPTDVKPVVQNGKCPSEPSLAAANGSGTAAASGSSRPGGKLVAVSACDRCNKRKARCDGPDCSSCRRAGVPCTYERESRKRGPQSGHIGRLYMRIKELEDELSMLQLNGQQQQQQQQHQQQQILYQTPPHRRRPCSVGLSGHVAWPTASLTSSFDPYFSSSSAYSSQPATTTAAPAAYQLPLFTSPDAGTGRSAFSSLAPHAHAADCGNVTQVTPPASGPSSVAGSGSPPGSTTQDEQSSTKDGTPLRLDLINRFFTYVHHETPLLSRPEFLCGMPEHSPLLLNAIYALAMTRPCTTCSSRQYMDLPSYSTITAFMFLCIYAAGCGNVAKALVYYGIAVRMAHVLCLQEELPLRYTCSLEEREFRRRIWFCIRHMDRIITTIRPDIPVSIQDEDCTALDPQFDNIWHASTELADLSLPSGSSAAYHESMFAPQAGASGLSFSSEVEAQSANELRRTLPIYIDILRINARVTTFVRSVVAHNPLIPSLFDPEIERAILASELDAWYEHLPPWLKLISQTYSSGSLTRQQMQWFVATTQATFYNCRIMVFGTHLSALAIATLAERMLVQNPMLVGMQHAMSIMFRNAGLVLGAAVRLRMFDDESAKIIKSKMGRLAQGIGRISTFWALAVDDRAVLEQVLETLS
ncbi:fungal-specific transcription factor domain-containing protein [Entophlyctis helioformis]|nr:fungal-specific transcription factor domain-containing protein [Entophlyctis helioformis]